VHALLGFSRCKEGGNATHPTAFSLDRLSMNVNDIPCPWGPRLRDSALLAALHSFRGGQTWRRGSVEKCGSIPSG
jgi:hypothetical protein